MPTGRLQRLLQAATALLLPLLQHLLLLQHLPLLQHLLLLQRLPLLQHPLSLPR